MRPRAGEPFEECPSLVATIVPSRSVTARGVKSAFTEPRTRVWSGGSM